MTNTRNSATPPSDDGTARDDPANAPLSTLTRVTNYTRAMQRIKGILLTGVGTDGVLQAVCREVVSAVPDADFVGITMLVGDMRRPETAASTDSTVNDVDADQYRADEGPCLEAARTGNMVRARADDVSDRWPNFAANVADIGVRSYLSAPLSLDDEHVGALNIYSYSTAGFSDIDEVLVALFVTSIEVAVAISTRARSAEREVDGLHTAMRTRADIEQAKGMIMAMRGITADQAFEVLSAQSQNRNVRVSDIAAALIESVAQLEDRVEPFQDSKRRNSARSDE